MTELETEAQRRRCYLASVERAGRYWQRYIQLHRDSMETLAQVQANLLHTVQTCSRHDETQTLAAELAEALQEYMVMRGNWVQWAAYLDDFLARTGCDDEVLCGILWQHLAEVLNRLERYPEAVECLEYAVSLLREHGTQGQLARLLINLAIALFNQRRWNECELVRREALALGEEIDDASVIADAIIVRGRIHHAQACYTEAAQCFDRARRIALASDDRPRVIGSTNFLGVAYLKQGRPEEALPHFETVFEMVRERGDRPGQGVVAYNLGETYLALECPALALDYFNTALTVTRQTDSRRFQPRILEALARAHVLLEEGELAVRYREEAQRIAQEG